MGTWRDTTTMQAAPADVLVVLRNPDACKRWSPIDFEIEGLCDERLRSGSRARIGGRLANKRLDFDVEVVEASKQVLELRASGPFEMDVAYAVNSRAGESIVEAAVAVRPGAGLTGRLLSRAADALLAGGALRLALTAIGREVEATAHPSRAGSPVV